MSALKYYKTLKGLDVLNKFEGTDFNGICGIFNKAERTICSCGKVYTKIVDTCECGNHNFKNIKEIRTFRPTQISENYDVKHGTDKNGDDIVIGTIFMLSVKACEETIEFSKETYDTIEIYKNNITTKNSIRVFARSEICEILEKEYKYISLYEKYFKFLSDDENSANFDLLRLEEIFQLNEINYFDDSRVFLYPKLAKTLLKNKIQSFEDGLKKFNITENFLESLNNEFNKRYIYYSSLNTFKEYNFFQYLNSKTEEEMYDSTYSNILFEMKNHLYKNIMNHSLTYIESFYIFDKFKAFLNIYTGSKYKNQGYLKVDLKDFEYIFEYKELLLGYMSERTNILTQNIFINFNKDVRFLKENKVLVTENNLKPKILSYYKNKYELAESLEYPNVKIDYFLDCFETNPLKAMELLKTKRNITKAQKEEFEKVLTK